jgi:hypothetical protein
MKSTTFSTSKSARTSEDHKDKDILAFYRFMIWAYEEAESTFDDKFLKAAIHTIIYYLSKHYKAGSKTNH